MRRIRHRRAGKVPSRTTGGNDMSRSFGLVERSIHATGETPGPIETPLRDIRRYRPQALEILISEARYAAAQYQILEVKLLEAGVQPLTETFRRS